MHHVKTFTKSTEFLQALFLEVSLHYKVFHPRNVHFIGHLRAVISQIHPLTLPPPKYSSSSSLVIPSPSLLLLVRLLVAAPHL